MIKTSLKRGFLFHLYISADRQKPVISNYTNLEEVLAEFWLGIFRKFRYSDVTLFLT